MSGYTPVFSSVFDGTLHGRWPHTGVWVCLLAMADRHGCVDMVPRKIAADIGIGVDELLVCIADFCAPDGDSRTVENDGRRLELIDETRPWGWRIINHGKYREKARKAASDSERVASGKEAERKRLERASRDVPRCPDNSRSVPPSDSDSDTNSDKKLRSASVKSLPSVLSEGVQGKQNDLKKSVRRAAVAKIAAAAADGMRMP